MYHQKTKDYLKKIAKEIKEYKAERKPATRKIDLPSLGIELEINKRKYEYRHFHIAYCELKGTIRERIEKPHVSNLPNERYVSEIKKQIMGSYAKEQALCDSKD